MTYRYVLNSLWTLALLWGVGVCGTWADDVRYVGPLDSPANDLRDQPLRDPVAQLMADLSAGRRQLQWEPQRGYLLSLLRTLHVPVESQVLVFSKTSFQNTRITPASPRAIYFNDDVYVGYVPGGDVIELASIDPVVGAIFRTLDQAPPSASSIKFAVNGQCLQCHQSMRTLNVPGLIVRSVLTHPQGFPILSAPYFDVDHRTELANRWGGWYVTGTTGSQTHMGNQTIPLDQPPETFNPARGSNLVDLTDRFDTQPYLTPHSDVAALMVLEHQTRFHNIVTVAAWETRQALMLHQAAHGPDAPLTDAALARIDRAAEAVVRYLLMADEVLLTDPIVGTSGFANVYAEQGPRDEQGRSLRQLRLDRTLFAYPCSPMIYSPSLWQLPPPIRDRIVHRINDLLIGRASDHSFHLSKSGRIAALEILRATLPDWPRE
jgi:hypothetical protein